MEAVVFEKETKKVKERYAVWLSRIDTALRPSNFKGQSIYHYAEAAMHRLRETGKRSTTFEVLGFLPELSDKNNPDLSSGHEVRISVQVCDIPREIWSISLEPKSACEKSKGQLGFRLEFGIKRLV